MHYRTLGGTGLNVSILGLGSGGASRLGQRYNFSSAETERLVKRALEAEVNLIDTAPTYSQSEALLGQALSGVPRDQYVLCTKFQPFADGNLLAPSDLRASLEKSLRALSTDFVDVFYLHGVAPARYAVVRDQFLPELQAAQQAGLVNPTAVTACVHEWEREGLLRPGAVQPDAPLDWLLDEQTPTIAAAAYKFAAAHPAVGTVLTGTASLDHFESNLQAILGPPLPQAKLQRVQDVFGPVQRNVQPERSERVTR